MFKAAITELIFPSRCLSCGSLGTTLCTRCRSQWNPHIYRQHFTGLTIYSSVKYSMTAQKIILGAKESGYKDCDELVIAALGKSLECFVREKGSAVLVPIPSKPSAQRKRGRDFVTTIAAQLGVECESYLQITKRVLDQSNLSHDQRVQNMAGAFSVTSIPQRDVILIDDIVTSGATLLEAKRAFARRGVQVKGAITAVMA